MERHVSNVLGKIVRKYGGKRPDVIVVALENPAAVLSEELNARLSGISHVGSGIPELRNVLGGHQVTNHPNHIKGENNYLEDEPEQKSEVAEKLLPETGSTSSFVNKVPLDSGNQDFASSPFEEWGDNLENHREDSEDGSMETQSSQLKRSESAKRNKWKPEEVKKLIGLRKRLHSKFQGWKARMLLWEEISPSLIADGFVRNPGQCKCIWASLVQKYEDIKNGETSQRSSWPYFEDINSFLSDSEALVDTESLDHMIVCCSTVAVFCRYIFGIFGISWRTFLSLNEMLVEVMRQ